jgi:hypothetical protein
MGWGAVHDDSSAPVYHELFGKNPIGQPATAFKRRAEPSSGLGVRGTPRRTPLFFVRHLALSTP